MVAPDFRENERGGDWLFYVSRRHLYDGWYLCLPADTQGNPRLLILVHESQLGLPRIKTYDLILPLAKKQ